MEDPSEFNIELPTIVDEVPSEFKIVFPTILDEVPSEFIITVALATENVKAESNNPNITLFIVIPPQKA